MLPFDMAVLDSGGDESEVRKIMKLCYVYLAATDKSREAAAVLVARLITRPDLHTVNIPAFCSPSPRSARPSWAVIAVDLCRGNATAALVRGRI